MIGRRKFILAGSAWVGLAMILGSACTTAGGTPAAAKPAAIAQPGTTASQKPAESKPAVSQFAASQAATGPAIDPCTLVTGAEMEAIVGKLRSGPEPLKGPNGDILECNYVTDDGGLVVISVADGVNWEIRESFAQPDDDTKVERIAGLGEKALYKSPEHGDDELYVLKRPYILELRSSADAEKNRQFMEAIAKIALPRLK